MGQCSSAGLRHGARVPRSRPEEFEAIHPGRNRRSPLRRPDALAEARPGPPEPAALPAAVRRPPAEPIALAARRPSDPARRLVAKPFLKEIVDFLIAESASKAKVVQVVPLPFTMRDSFARFSELLDVYFPNGILEVPKAELLPTSSEPLTIMFAENAGVEQSWRMRMIGPADDHETPQYVLAVNPSLIKPAGSTSYNVFLLATIDQCEQDPNRNNVWKLRSQPRAVALAEVVFAESKQIL